MKRKYISLAAILFFTAGLLSAKTKLTIKDTVGADPDEVGDYRLFSTDKENDINDSTQSAGTFAIGNRFQAELENYYLTAKFRLETIFHKTSGSELADYEDHSAVPNFVIAPSGFLHFTPIQQIGFVAGTNFYKHFAIPSAYLAGADDTTKYGRLLTDSLGEDRYFGSDQVGIYTNGFAGGATSYWNFGDMQNIYIKLAGGGTFYPEKDEFEKAIDFGANAGILNMFDLGFTAHNVTEDDRKFGAFAGLTRIENFILNAGFYYNFTDSDYLPEARVTRTDDNDVDYYKYKKQSTKYALGLTTGYKFLNSLGIYADFITGLTNEYIGEIKYYDNSGNLIKSEITTIVRGETAVKYKYNSKGVLKAKRTDEYSSKTLPVYAQFRLTYDITDSIKTSFNFKMRTMLNDASSTWLTFYPKCTLELPSNGGTIGTGLRLDMNFTRYEGVSSISIPLTYTYKFKRKF